MKGKHVIKIRREAKMGFMSSFFFFSFFFSKTRTLKEAM